LQTIALASWRPGHVARERRGRPCRSQLKKLYYKQNKKSTNKNKKSSTSCSLMDVLVVSKLTDDLPS